MHQYVSRTHEWIPSDLHCKLTASWDAGRVTIVAQNSSWYPGVAEQFQFQKACTGLKQQLCMKVFSLIMIWSGEINEKIVRWSEVQCETFPQKSCAAESLLIHHPASDIVGHGSVYIADVCDALTTTVKPTTTRPTTTSLQPSTSTTDVSG